jgi:Zn-dependent metalloprotease
MHSQADPESMRAIEGAASVGAGGTISGHEFAGLDPETAARHYLKTALQSSELPAFAAAGVNGDRDEFRNLGVEAQPLTGTQTVKFRQMFRRIPVYGSLVTIELDGANNLISINSGLGEPTGVSPVAKVSPSDAIDVVRRAAGYGATPLEATPRLFYYFDNAGSRWRLVYILEDVAKPAAVRADAAANAGGDAVLTGMPEYSDYVVDANTGDLVAELPRTHNAVATGVDGLDTEREFEVIAVPGVSGASRMHDQSLNIRTHDFRFQNLMNPAAFQSLPGPFVDNPPQWSPAAVSAHVNAAAVARFLKDVLKRNGLDNLGSPITSSVNCVASAGTQEWRNAAWLGGRKQMVYGQRSTGNGAFRSYAVALDVVAHEVLHGLTDNTARLVYQGMSGALNESYSDIFGIIVANFSQPDIGRWDWRLGEELSVTGIPLRDLSNPRAHNQPDHMDDYRDLPLDDANDHGGVHINSGIHNKAAFNLLTTKRSGGGFLFTAQEVAAIFYLTLTQHLAATSGFSDSRRGAGLATQSLFRTATDKNARVQAVADAFDKVGIT